MDYNFENILTYTTLALGAIIVVDSLVFGSKRRRKAAQAMGDGQPSLKLPWLVEQARAFFPVLLLVVLLRSFLFEFFRIPSGSLKPTLLEGDMVVVNKFAYGLRLPVLHTKILEIGEPARGDIAVFHWPIAPGTYLIKRLVGVPNDKISYQDKVLAINDRVATQSYQKNTFDKEPSGLSWTVLENQEDLLGIKHSIFLKPDAPAQNLSNILVPDEQYFAMGDNRDNSNDSRYWGFVPESNLVGKATWILFSWDSQQHKVRWERIGMRIR